MKIRIMDDTLREGEQTPGIRYTADSRVRIFEKIVDVGIDLVNVGSPSVKHNLEGIKKISDLGYNDVELVGHIGCSKSEVDKAVGCGLESIKMYLAPTKDHLMAKFGKKFNNLEEARGFCLDKVEETVRYAKERGTKIVSYTAEDITSALAFKDEEEFSYKVLRVALENGASRISVPDTRGRCNSDDVRKMITNLKNSFKSYNPEIEVHFHNDLGLALSNTLEAVENGANIAHVTVNGMGERVGITDLAQLVTGLYYKHGIDTGLKHDKLYELSRFVEEESGFRVPKNAPVVGYNASTHTSGRHQQAVINNPMTYQTVEPSFSGREPMLSFGALTGKDGLRGFIEECGVDTENIDDFRITSMVDSIRKYHVKTGISDISIVRDVIQRDIGTDIKLPDKYKNSIYGESYITIKTEAGEDEILTKSKLMSGLKKMPFVVRVDEIFGSQNVDYMATMRYSSIEYDKIMKKVRSNLTQIKNVVKDYEVFDVGDSYRA